MCNDNDDSTTEYFSEPDPAAVGFILRLGRALHGYGEASHRLEDIICALAKRLGLGGAQFFSQPTSIMASFGPVEYQRTYMLRVEPGDVDLGKLAEVEKLSIEVAGGRMSPREGSAGIERIAKSSSRYRPFLTTLAFGGISGATCPLLGGGWRETLVALVLGLGLHLFLLLSGRQSRVSRLTDPLAAFLLSFAAVALSEIVGPHSVLIATLSGLIVLLPGLTLTTALSELANRHLASGTARLSGAFITLLGLAFGVALGGRLGTALLAAPMGPVAPMLPDWAIAAALVLSPLCAVVIFNAPPRDAPWIVAASVLGVMGARWGTAGLGPELGAFVGALVIGLASNAYARWRRRTPAIVLVPSLLPLVPGSIGLRGLTWLVEHQALAGVEAAFSMLLTAVALVAGLLIAGVIAPEPHLRNFSES